MSKLEGLRARAAERRERFLASGKESYGGAVDAWEGQAQERVERRTAYKKADTRDARDQARVAVMLALEEEEAKAEERERRAAQRSAWQVQLDEKAYAAEREREFDAKVRRRHRAAGVDGEWCRLPPAASAPSGASLIAATHSHPAATLAHSTTLSPLHTHSLLPALPPPPHSSTASSSTTAPQGSHRCASLRGVTPRQTCESGCRPSRCDAGSMRRRRSHPRRRRRRSGGARGRGP